MFHQTSLKTGVLAAIIAGLLAYAAFGGYFAREIVIEIAILAMLAVALDLVAGYGGMISLCHGAVFGLGAFALAAPALLPPRHLDIGGQAAVGRGRRGRVGERAGFVALLV